MQYNLFMYFLFVDKVINYCDIDDSFTNWLAVGWLLAGCWLAVGWLMAGC